MTKNKDKDKGNELRFGSAWSRAIRDQLRAVHDMNILLQQYLDDKDAELKQLYATIDAQAQQIQALQETVAVLEEQVQS